MTPQHINIISLGCSKNLVDSERLLKMCEDYGIKTTHNAAVTTPCDAVVINTCGFIADAKEESINTILEAVQAKEEGLTEAVYVMGCLSQRYPEQLASEIPEVDGWYGKMSWVDLLKDIGLRRRKKSRAYERKLTTPPYSTYLKIAEGCNRFCAFCAIPHITGRYTSRPMDEILEEVEWLVSKGVKEFNVIAQEITRYGADLYGKVAIAELIDKIAQIEGVEWIRLHYAYPSEFPDDLLDVMAKHRNVCRYLDIALQHVADPVLANMRRHISGEETRALLAKIRARVPGIHIRTTLMVGFPGEGDKEFDELMEFVREQRFERMGAFAYCEEEDTYAAKNFSDEIPEEVKTQRLDALMSLQEEISQEINNTKIGSTIRVLIESEEADYYVGRSEFDSPEVDPEVLVEKIRPLTVGEFYDVIITESMPFDLIGKPC